MSSWIIAGLLTAEVFASADMGHPHRSVYTLLMAESKADVFLTYCTNAIVAALEAPGLKVISCRKRSRLGPSTA